MAVHATPKLNPTSAQIVANLAAQEYNGEMDRSKVLDGKSATMLATASAATLFVAGNLTRVPASLPPSWRPFYLIGICFTFTGLLISLYFFLLALRIEQYRRIKLSEWIPYSTLQDDPAQVQAQLASTLFDAYEYNSGLNEKKAVAQDRGLLVLLGAIALLAVLLLTSGVSVNLAVLGGG